MSRKMHSPAKIKVETPYLTALQSSKKSKSGTKYTLMSDVKPKVRNFDPEDNLESETGKFGQNLNDLYDSKRLSCQLEDPQFM